MREARAKAIHRLIEKGSGDVDRHIQTRRLQGVDENFSLDAGTRTVLQHDRMLAAEARDVLRMPLKNLSLGPRQVVLSQAGDLFEQLASPVIVEPPAGQRFARLRQAAQDVKAKRFELPGSVRD